MKTNASNEAISNFCRLAGALFAASVGCGSGPAAPAVPASDGTQPSAGVDASSGSAGPGGDEGGGGRGTPSGSEAGPGAGASSGGSSGGSPGPGADAHVRSETDAASGGAAAVPVGGGDGASSSDAMAALGLCTAPTGAKSSDAQAAYTKWKTDLVTSTGAGGFRRVLRPNSPNAVNTSNSEGTGYGMILAVAMNDQTLFEDRKS